MAIRCGQINKGMPIEAPNKKEQRQTNHINEVEQESSKSTWQGEL